MKYEKILVELPPYYRGLLDQVRLLIHTIRPDLGPPTQSHCVQFLLNTFPVTPLLVQAMQDREKFLTERVKDELGEPAIPILNCDNPAGLWATAIKQLELAKPAAGQRKRRRSRTQ